MNFSLQLASFALRSFMPPKALVTRLNVCVTKIKQLDI